MVYPVQHPYLLEGIAGIVVHDNRDKNAVVADAGVLLPLRIGAVVGIGSAGLVTGIHGTVLGVPLFE